MNTASHIASVVILSMLIAFGLTGCLPRVALELMESTEIPLYDGSVEDDYINLKVLFLINRDGDVEDVHLVSGSGVEQWDVAVADSMRKWRFKSFSFEGPRIWVRQDVKIELLPPMVLNIGELIAAKEEDASLLYSRLRRGESFEQLVRQSQEDPESGFTGRFRPNVDTFEFPVHISKILLDLKSGEFTNPVITGENFVIYKRFGQNMPEGPEQEPVI